MGGRDIHASQQNLARAFQPFVYDCQCVSHSIQQHHCRTDFINNLKVLVVDDNSSARLIRGRYSRVAQN
ncbi:hypothetical protein O9992_00360 [Vibrio lentus]|nr:hypothetical protein [Vibrio lentus]